MRGTTAPPWIWWLPLLLLGPALAGAGTIPLPAPAPLSANAPADPAGRSTPHGTVVEFLRAAAREDYRQAAAYLDVRRGMPAAEELARQLQGVLNSGDLKSLENLSRAPEGQEDDDLPPGREWVGTIRTAAGPLEVYLDRVQRGQSGPIWLFAADTLRRIPRAYEEVRPHWLERHLPASLAAIRLVGFPLWQWLLSLLSIPVAVALAWPLNRVLTPLLRALLRRLTEEEEEDERLLRRIAWPCRLLVLAATIRLGGQLLALPYLASLFWFQVSFTLAVLAATWLLVRLADLLGWLMVRRLERAQRTGRTALVHLGRRLGKAALVLTGVLFLLSWAGVNLTAALAGLGLGGLAIAFSAQKTLENLFGGIMLISDRAIRVGEFCQIGEHLGTVEDIGLRSTRLRTLNRTVVNIPNGQLATMSLVNFASRDKIWFRHIVGLRYETTPDQLRHVLAEIRRLLYAHPRVEPESARVRLIRFGGSSLDLELFAYVLETDFAAFLGIQEDLLLRILEIVAASGTAVAFPSSTTYLARDPGLDPAGRQAAEEAVRAWREGQELPFPDFAPERIAELRGSLPYPPPGSARRPPESPKAE